VAKYKPLIRPLLHGFVECGSCNVYMPDRCNDPSDVQGVLIPQLHPVTHICDVVEVGILKFPQQLIHHTIQVGIRVLDEGGFPSQPLKYAERIELAVLVRGLLTHENKTRTLAARSQAYEA
jgi:hypothetical protein